MKNTIVIVVLLLGILEGISAEEQSTTAVNNNILCSPTCTLSQMKKWAKNKSSYTTATFLANADYVYSYAKKVGVNPCLVYVQYAYETLYGAYGGQVKESYKNTCGLKNSNGTWAQFATWELGIEAHIDHLALYAGAKGYPRSGSPDPKHFASLLGCATTIDAMGLKWANGQTDYASKIKSFMAEVQATVADPTLSVSTASLTMSTTVGSTVTQTFTVTGSAITTTIGVSSNNSLFTVSPTSLPMAGGKVTVKYTPTTAGAHSATITVKSSGASNVTVSVSGTAKNAPLAFTQVWNYSETSGNKKDWATDFSTIRNMDYSAGKLYVVTNGGKITVVNAQTGATLGDLSSQGISGGAINLVDCKVISSKIVACNVTTSTATPLKVYVWDNDNAHPRVLLSTTDFGGVSRIGDCISVQGNLTNGVLYFAGGSITENNKVICYQITNGVCSTSPTTKTMLNASGEGMKFGFSPLVQPNADGKWWCNGANYYPSLFDANGTLIATLNAAAVGSVCSGNAFKAFSFNGVNYGVATTYNAGTPTITAGRVALFDATNGWSAAEKIGEYPSAGLGTTRNTSFSTSVAVAVNGTSGVEMWVLVHNQGVAYFKYGTTPTWNPIAPNPGFETGTIEYHLSNDNLVISNNSECLYVGDDVQKIELYTLTGQKIRVVDNQNEMSVSGLQGIYLVIVQDKKNVVKVGKIIIR